MVSSLPYIPGSALRGKLRMLLVRKLDKPIRKVAQAGGRPIRLHFCQDENCEVCRLFGSVPPPDREEVKGQASTREPWSLPAALHVTDLRLHDPAQFGQSERKNENALDRMTAQSNPRQIERIPQGTRFTFFFTYYIRRPDHLEEDLRNLLATLALLQDDTLGGHGSRGYGAVSISLEKIDVQRFGVSPQQERRKTDTLELPLEGAREQINQVLPEIKAFLVSLPEAISPQPKEREEPSEVLRYVACLRFTSPLHVGEPRVGLEGCVDTVSSDTLFSALANAWVTLYGKHSLEELINDFKRAAEGPDDLLPFWISSAFPYLNEQFFFPKPFSHPGQEEWNEEEGQGKALKDLKFLPADLFHDWIAGHLKANFKEQLERELKKQKEEKLSAKDILPRVRLDRLDLASNLYFCGQIYFPEDGGLYFLVQGKEAILEKLRKALQLLGELGLGGERALGFGRFKVRAWKKVQEVETLRFLSSDVGLDAFLTLSLYHPSPQEMSDLIKNRENVLLGYQLIERGGWVDSPELRFALHKKTCRLFAEGSVFRTKPRGCLIDVTPEPANQAPHRVYRYGFAFPVGIVQQQ
jgi:CRISPR type III-A-associated RAMP protein Csm4/CRISPR type III-A-associated RAMP protein Csm3